MISPNDSSFENAPMPYLEKIVINLNDADDTVLNLNESYVFENGIIVNDSVSADGTLQVGGAIINQITITLFDKDDEWENIDFLGAEIAEISLGKRVSATVIDYIKKGTNLTVVQASYSGALLTLTCQDKLRLFDKNYSDVGTVYPASLQTIVNDICDLVGVELATQTFPHYNYQLTEAPDVDSLTCRELLSYIAQICGCFARINASGKLELKWYDINGLNNKTAGHYWRLDEIYNSVIGHSPVKVSGVSVLVQNPDDDPDAEPFITYVVGNEDSYVVNIEANPLINLSNVSTIANFIYDAVKNMNFYRADVSTTSDPRIEAGDVAIIVDRKGNERPCIISSTTFNSSSMQSITSSIETPSITTADRYSSNTKNIIAIKKEVAKEQTARESAIATLAQQIANAGGLFTTIASDGAGGSIYYLHNKSTLAGSNIVWKMTAEAFAVTTNYQGASTVWNSGLSADGTAIAERLYVHGINADYINSGKIEIKDANNNVIFLVDFNASKVESDKFADQEQLYGTIADINDFNAKFAQRVRIDNTGLTIGAYGDTDNPDFSIRITNDRIQFLQQGTEIAYISDYQLYIPDSYSARAHIGRYMFTESTDGTHFSLIKEA